MNPYLLTATGLSLLLMTVLVNAAEPQVNVPADMKITNEQCVTIWKQAEAADTVKAEPEALPVDVVRPFVKDITKTDTDGSRTISTKEWAVACEAGWVMTSPAVPAEKIAPQAP